MLAASDSQTRLTGSNRKRLFVPRSVSSDSFEGWSIALAGALLMGLPRKQPLSPRTVSRNAACTTGSSAAMMKMCKPELQACEADADCKAMLNCVSLECSDMRAHTVPGDRIKRAEALSAKLGEAYR